MSTFFHEQSQVSFSRLPSWFKQRVPEPAKMMSMKKILTALEIHTVCEEARCPNQGECWSRKTATFLILGDICTRACRFCAVKTGQPLLPDPDEPQHVAESVRELGLHYAVVTSVTRDDLFDQGAGHFVKTIDALRRLNPSVKIEVLIPDFSGRIEYLNIVAQRRPDVMGHNIETVARLAKEIRPQADYNISLDVLRNMKRLNPDLIVKSGFMVGLGETSQEITALLEDLVATGCDILTIGQYLAPSTNKKHIPVQRFVSPEEFETFRKLALRMGFRHVVSGPLVRSSFMAEKAFDVCRTKPREESFQRERMGIQ